MKIQYEKCKCQGCGGVFIMPDMSQFEEGALGTFDVASWVFCTPQCLCQTTGLKELPWWHSIYRPFFRWNQKRLFKRLLIHNIKYT